MTLIESSARPTPRTAGVLAGEFRRRLAARGNAVRERPGKRESRSRRREEADGLAERPIRLLTLAATVDTLWFGLHLTHPV